MRSRVQRLLVVPLLLASLAGVPATPAMAQQSAPDPAPNPMVAQLERSFLQGMIPHHRGAVMMAELAVQKGARPELRRFAQQIIDDQRAEVDKMTHFLRDWYGVEPPAGTAMPMESMMGMMAGMMAMPTAPGAAMSPGAMPGMQPGGHDEHSPSPGMMPGAGMPMMGGMMADEAARMRALETKTGADFDVEFLSAMTGHHAMAVMMAAHVLMRGHHADLYTLAEGVVISQGQEIRQMDEWLGAWYGAQRPL